MKGFYGALLIGLLILSSCGSSSTVETPKEISRQVFDLLKEFDGMTIKEFESYFITYNELKDLSENKELMKEQSGRESLSKITRLELLDLKRKMFDKLKKRGVKYRIKWSDIQFVSFDYEIENNDGIKACEGKLLVKHRGKPFYVRTYSIYNGSGYTLTNIRIRSVKN